MSLEALKDHGSPNILAYKEAFKRGDFEDLDPSTYVFFFEGEFAASCPPSELDEVRKRLLGDQANDFFYTQPNKPRRPRGSLYSTKNRR